jgi:hypothetical protein
VIARVAVTFWELFAYSPHAVVPAPAPDGGVCPLSALLPVNDPACAVFDVDGVTVHPSAVGVEPLRAAKAKLEEELRGLGADTKQSAELLFVSIRPPPRRNTAVVADIAGAAVPEFEFSGQSPVP